MRIDKFFDEDLFMAENFLNFKRKGSNCLCTKQFNYINFVQQFISGSKCGHSKRVLSMSHKSELSCGYCKSVISLTASNYLNSSFPFLTSKCSTFFAALTVSCDKNYNVSSAFD